MKKCKYCNGTYPESEFGVALTTPDKIYRRNKCRYCYLETKRKLRIERRRWIDNYKKGQECSWCGEKDYRVLDFHHKNKKDKGFGIGFALTNGIGVKRLKKEISKCIILCSNCHRKIHYNDTNRGVV